jgi:hypothetical protein
MSAKPPRTSKRSEVGVDGCGTADEGRSDMVGGVRDMLCAFGGRLQRLNQLRIPASRPIRSCRCKYALAF